MNEATQNAKPNGRALATKAVQNEPAAEHVKLDALTPWKKNPKSIEPKDVRELARSIRRFGFGSPIVARKANGEIIAGHLRYAAAKHLRLETVPVRFMDLGENEAHAMAIADTKIQQRRDFDEEQLAQVMESLEEEGVDLTHGTGFDDDAIDEILSADSESGSSKDKSRGAKKLGGLMYRIVIDCKDEIDQATLLDRLESEGLLCRPLMH